MNFLRSRKALGVRVAIYVIALVVLTVVSKRAPWSLLSDAISTRQRSDTTLTVAGSDLCPRLARALGDRYLRDYPDLKLALPPGGNNQALEMVLNHEADVALLVREPSPAELALSVRATGDSLQALRIAHGALELVGPRDGAVAVDLQELRARLRGEEAAPFYAPDPNFGLWDALCASLSFEGAPGPNVVFLADPATVLQAVRDDPGAWGLHWSLGEEPGPLLRVLSVAEPGEDAVAPLLQTVAEGSYPLLHPLYVALLGNGPVEGRMFATHLTSGRGQRQIEREGAVPDRLVLREIRLTRGEIGDDR